MDEEKKTYDPKKHREGGVFILTPTPVEKPVDAETTPPPVKEE